MIKKDENQKEVEEHLFTTVKQSSIVFIGKFSGYILGFVINFLIARFFGSKIMGQYSLVKTVVYITGIFAVFGFDQGLVKYIPKYNTSNQNKKLNQVVKIAFIYGMTFSIIGSIVIFLFRFVIANSFFNDPELASVLVYGSWLIITLTCIRLFKGLYRGFQQLKYYVISFEFIRRLGFIFIIVLLFIIKVEKAEYIVMGLLLAEFFSILYLFIKAKKLNLDLKNNLFNFGAKKIRNEFIKYSSVLVFTTFMLTVLNRIDRIMIGIYESSKMVGIYNIVVLVGRLSLFFLMSANMVFESIVSVLYSQNKFDILQKMYFTVLKWIIVLTFPITISTVIFSKTIMGFFGQEYLIGVMALIIIVIGQFINASISSISFLLKVGGHEKILLMNNFLMAIINIILNVFLIPKYGITGAALATSFSIVTINLIKILQTNWLMGIIPYNKEIVYVLLNFSVISIITFIANKLYNNIVMLIVITSINILISILISYIFKEEIDRVLFKRIKGKLFKK